MKKKIISVILSVVLAASPVSVAASDTLEIENLTDGEDDSGGETEIPDNTSGEVEISQEPVEDSTETSSVDDSSSEPDFISDGSEIPSESETQPSETENTTPSDIYKVDVSAEHAEVFFSSDLKKLKDGTLKEPETGLPAEDALSDGSDAVEVTPEPETETEAQEDIQKDISRAKEFLPDDISELLTEDTYKLLKKQEHAFKVQDAVSFYAIPDEGYEIFSVKATDTYNELTVTDYDNNVYEVTMPASDMKLQVEAAEESVEITEETEETESETETETESETEEEEETEKTAECTCLSESDDPYQHDWDCALFVDTFLNDCSCDSFLDSKVTSHDFECDAFKKALAAVCTCDMKDAPGMHDNCEVIKRMHDELCDCGEEYDSIDDIIETHDGNSEIVSYLMKWAEYCNKPMTASSANCTTVNANAYFNDTYADIFKFHSNTRMTYGNSGNFGGKIRTWSNYKSWFSKSDFPKNGVAFNVGSSLNVTDRSNSYYWVRYSNVYKNYSQWYDLFIRVDYWSDGWTVKGTCDDGKTHNVGPTVVFDSNQIACRMINLKSCKFSWSLVKSGTNNKGGIKAHMVVADIDNYQSVLFNDSSSNKPDVTYRQSGNSFLRVVDTSTTRAIKAGGTLLSPSDKRGWAQLDFTDGCTFYFKDNPNASEKSPHIIRLDITPNTVAAGYNINTPNKSSGPQGTVREKQLWHNSTDTSGSDWRQPLSTEPGGTYTYGIEHVVYPVTYYSSYKITDKLDPCLTYVNGTAKIYQQQDASHEVSAVNMTGYFNIAYDSGTHTLTFSPKSYDTIDARVNYYYTFDVKVADTATILKCGNKHLENTTYCIGNVASVEENGQTRNTWTSYFRGNLTCKVNFDYNKPDTEGNVESADTANKTTIYNTTYGTLPAPSLTGYTFDGWYTAASGGTRVTEDTKYTVAGDSTLYAHWSPIQYTIVYDGNENTGGSTPSSTHTYDVESALSKNGFTKDGYHFVGWNTPSGKFYKEGENVKNIISQPRQVLFFAEWAADTYNITYDLKGGSVSDELKTSYTIETDTFALPIPTKTGYVFTGWTGSNGSTAQTDVSIAKGSTGNKNYTANWSATGYTVSFDYNKPSTDGRVANSSTSSKSVAYDAAYGTLPAPTLNGYTFAGWFTAASNGSRVTETTKYTTDGNSTLYAHWNLNTYSIGYTLNGGSISGQPTSYNVNTATFTLPQPTRNGYSFTGWTGSNGSTAQKTVTVAKNSTGNKSYTANWSPVSYSISYTLNGGSMSGQKTSYTIETDTFTLPQPTRNGYTFTGWTGTGLSSATKSVSVTKGSTGNRSYTANWSANGYTVSFNYNKPSTDGTVGNAETSSKGVTFDAAYGTLPAPTLNGYTFAGWFTAASNGSRVTETTKYTTAGNSTLYAHWSLNTYSIGYTLNGGSISGQPTSYNVNTATFTLPQPTKNGYSFTGWTGSNGSTAQKTVTVAKNSTGNKSYTANWSPVSYSISYNLNGGSMSGQKTSYTIETDTFTLPQPTKNGYTFTGWTGSNGTTAQKSVSITKGSTGDKTYTANWKINQYTLTITGDDGVESIAGNGKYDYGTTANVTYKIKAGYHIVSTAGTTSTGGKGTWTVCAGKESTVSDSWSIEACDRNIKVNTALNAYTVKYDGNTATGGSTASSSHIYDTAKELTPNGFSKTGYTFSGWNTSADGKGTAYADKASVKSLTAANNDTVTLYAQWTPNELTIQYHADGAEKYDSNGDGTEDKDVIGKDILETTCFLYDVKDSTSEVYGLMDANRLQKSGYHCNNTWVVRKDGTVKVDSAKVFSTAQELAKMCGVTTELEKGNVTVDLHPDWKINTGTIHYYPNGDNVTLVKSTSSIVQDGEYAGSIKESDMVSDFDYNTKGGKGANTLTDVSSIFARKGYHTSVTQNWHYGSPDSETDFHCDEEDLSPYVKDNTGVHLKLYANWIANPYAVKFDGNGADSGNIQDISATYDTSFTLPESKFVRKCYEFTGWNTEKDGSGKNYAAKESVKNLTDEYNGTVTLYAQWKLSTYNVIFKENGGSGTMEAQTMTFDKEEALKENRFTRTGYTFQGWNTKENGSGDTYSDKQKITNLSKDGSDVILYAQWKLITYDLTVSNKIAGSMGNKTKDFTFQMKLSSSVSDISLPTNLKAIFTDENGKKTEKNFTIANGTVNFTLSHKESLTFKDIPYGTVYAVSEPDNDGYTVTSISEKGTLTSDASVTFTNTLKGTVPTSADAPVPYVLVVMVFCFLIVLCIRRKIR